MFFFLQSLAAFNKRSRGKKNPWGGIYGPPPPCTNRVKDIEDHHSIQYGKYYEKSSRSSLN